MPFNMMHRYALGLRAISYCFDDDFLYHVLKSAIVVGENHITWPAQKLVLNWRHSLVSGR